MLRSSMLFVYCFLFVFFAGARDHKIRGRIIDDRTLEPIPYAMILMRDIGVSTISNDFGVFELKLPQNISEVKVDVEIIGYKEYSREIKNSDSFVICKLTESPIKLDEVIVVPKDTVRNILRTAFKSIIKNYPQTPSLTKGFYREVQKEDDSLYSFTEAMLNVYKGAYSNSKKNYGQIEILKSRKTKTKEDSPTSVRFYGGTHLALSSDLVFKPPKFVLPKHLNKYNYEFRGELKMGKYSVFLIDFSNKKGNVTGSMYIDKDSFAYIGFDIVKKTKKNGGTFISPYKITLLSKKVRFKFVNGKWTLSHILFKHYGEFKQSQNKVTVQSEFITTSVKSDSVSPIPYERQFSETDIISSEAEEYTNTTWKNYEELRRDSTFLSLSLYSIKDASQNLHKSVCTTSSKREKLIKIIKKLTGKIGVGYNPVKSKGGQYYVFFKDKEGESIEKVKKISPYNASYHLYMEMSYLLDKYWGIYYGSTASFNSIQDYETNNLGVSYTLPLSKVNRRNFLEVGLSYTFASYKLSLGKGEKSADKIIIRGKKFDENKINILWGKHSHGISPSLTLHHKIGRFTYLFASISSFFELNSKNKITFKERSGFFLNRKKQKVETDNQNLILRYNNSNVTAPIISKPDYQINFGISYRF